MAMSAVQQVGQLGLYEAGLEAPSPAVAGWPVPAAGMCEGCRMREARYGFRRGRGTERRTTLCFQCFRSELGRRQDVAERMRRGWNATQPGLPLAETLEALRTRRRRAQIAARHALEGTSPAPRAPRVRPKAS